MAGEPNGFLGRWSRRKHEAARTPQPASEAPPAAPADAAGIPAAVPAAPVESPPLPPVESLTIDSDFTPFLSAKVEETVKRAALRKLFSDPRFNVMDGLDVYIDDYSKPDPMPEGLLDRLAGVYRTLEEKVAQIAPEEAAAAEPDAQGEAPAAPEESDERRG